MRSPGEGFLEKPCSHRIRTRMTQREVAPERNPALTPAVVPVPSAPRMTNAEGRARLPVSLCALLTARHTAGIRKH